MDHFVAYHSLKQMGRHLEPQGGLNFLSRKLGILRKAIGNTVWVLQGAPAGKRTEYSLLGSYIADSVEELSDEPGSYRITGTNGTDISPPIALNELPWFQALQKSQSNFSLGFNRVSDPTVVGALVALRESDSYSSESTGSLPDLDLDLAVVEGALRLTSHLCRERSRSLVERKKRAVFLAKGNLACEACGFDFLQAYGDWGADFCEVHHKVPLAAADAAAPTRLEDLAVICSNCHRVIHRVNPMPSVEGLFKHVSRRGTETCRSATTLGLA